MRLLMAQIRAFHHGFGRILLLTLQSAFGFAAECGDRDVRGHMAKVIVPPIRKIDAFSSGGNPVAGVFFPNGGRTVLFSSFSPNCGGQNRVINLDQLQRLQRSLFIDRGDSGDRLSEPTHPFVIAKKVHDPANAFKLFSL